jgi:hypothetical protein
MAERLEPQDPIAEAEPLHGDFSAPLLSVPFATGGGELTLLEAAPEDETPIIMERDGVSYINERILAPDQGTLKGLNPSIKYLVDSILNKD